MKLLTPWVAAPLFVTLNPTKAVESVNPGISITGSPPESVTETPVPRNLRFEIDVEISPVESCTSMEFPPPPPPPPTC